MDPGLGHSGGGPDGLEPDERGREARKGVVVKAIRLHARGGLEQVVYEDAPLPDPAAGEALLRVYAAGITPTELTWSETYQTLPHRHAGPVFGYVLEGEYEHALNDDPVKTYKAGDTFYEPSGCVHRVTRNPSTKSKARLLAVILHPRDAREVTVPEKVKKE